MTTPLPQRFAGRVAVVTGAASGIGRAIALRLLGEGAKVVFADVNEAGLQSTLESLPADQRERSILFRLDVSEEADHLKLRRWLPKEHGSFGKFLAAWPADDQVGLAAYLARNGSRLGGNTGQYLLRWLGWDTFILSGDMVLALRDAGLDIAENPSSRKDLAAVQQQINRWTKESGLPRAHISRILALSIGTNRTAEELRQYMGG